jgi:GNAT superfamily N-acetyltransferase
MTTVPPKSTIMHASWIPMLPKHLDDVVAVADLVHQDYPEEREIFAERLALFPEGCFVARDSGPAGAVVGYALSHPGIIMQPPPLNCLLGTLPTVPDCLYLHDVALLRTAQGLGLGRSLVRRLSQLAKARAMGPLALTAVNSSVRYWHGHGFDIIEPTPALAEKLRSYSDDAAYMVCALDG